MAGRCTKLWTKIMGICFTALSSYAWLLAGFLSLYFICIKIHFTSMPVTASMPCLLEQTNSIPYTAAPRGSQSIWDRCLGKEMLSLLQGKESHGSNSSVQSICCLVVLFP